MKNVFHLILFGFALCTVSCGGASEADVEQQSAVVANQQDGPVLLSKSEFAEKMHIPDVQLIDVRTDGEVAEGMIGNAVQMDISDWDAFVDSVATLDPAKPVLVYCKKGGRSAQAAEYLFKEGYEVYDLDGGFDAWSK